MDTKSVRRPKLTGQSEQELVQGTLPFSENGEQKVVDDGKPEPSATIWCECGHTKLAHGIGGIGVCTIAVCDCRVFEENPVLQEDNRPPVEQETIGVFQTGRIMTDIRYLMMHMGLDPREEGLRDTPRRVAELFREFCQPADLAAILKDGFDATSYKSKSMVVQTGIPFRGMCEHHFLPFSGRACFGYLPSDRVVGLSKITRLVQAAGTLRPSTQEQITDTVADIFHRTLNPLGTIVVTSAIHGCMSVRGVNSPGIWTKVSAARGNFMHVPAARDEFLGLIKEDL